MPGQLSSEDQLELVESLPDTLYTVDMAGKFTFINRAAATLIGVAPEEMLGRPFLEVIAPEHREMMMQKFRSRLAGTEFGAYPVLVLRKDGTKRWVELNNVAIRKGAVPIGVRGSARDITERMELEAATVRRHARLSGLFEVSQALNAGLELSEVLATSLPTLRRLVDGDGIWVLGTEGRSPPELLGCDGHARDTVRAALAALSPDEPGTPFRTAVRRRAPVIVADVAADPHVGTDFVRLAATLGIRSAVVLPLLQADKVRGLLVIFSQAPRTPDHEEIAFLETTAGVLAAAVTNTVLFADLRRATDRLGETLAEEANQKGMFEAIQGAMHDGMLLISADDRILVWNRRAEQIYGIPAREVLGKTAAAVGERFLRGIRDPQHIVQWSQTMLTDRESRGSTMIQLGDKDPLDLQIFTSPVYDVAGKYIGRLWVTTDFTPLVQAEARYKALYDEAPDLYHTSDRDGRIVECNGTELAILGYSRDEFVGHPIFEFVAPEHRAMLRERRNRIFEGGEVTEELEFQMLRKDGTLLDVAGRSAAVRDEHGTVTLVRVVLRDITERKRLERKLADYTTHLEDEVHRRSAELVQAEKMASLGHLVAGTAHAINNPLTYTLSNTQRIEEDLATIAGALALLQSRRPGTRPPSLPALLEVVDRLRSLAHSTRTGMERIADFVERLRTFVRPGEGPTTEVDVNEVVRDTFALVRLQFRPGVTLVEDLRPVPAVRGNRNDLNEALMNLVVNAEQAIPENGIIRVATRVRNGSVELQVRDSGKGMDAQVLGRLYEPFFTTKGAGTGLGLSITRRIVEGMGGGIEVESAVGRGSTFTVTLPAIPAPPSPGGRAEAGLKSGNGASATRVAGKRRSAAPPASSARSRRK